MKFFENMQHRLFVPWARWRVSGCIFLAVFLYFQFLNPAIGQVKPPDKKTDDVIDLSVEALQNESLACIEKELSIDGEFQSIDDVQARQQFILTRMDPCVPVMTKMINAINDRDGRGAGMTYFKSAFLTSLADVMTVRLGVLRSGGDRHDGQARSARMDQASVRAPSARDQTQAVEPQDAQAEFKTQNDALNACVLKTVDTYLVQNESSEMIAKTAYGKCQKFANAAFLGYLRTLKKSPTQMKDEESQKYQNFFHNKKIESYARYVIDQRAKKGVNANTLQSEHVVQAQPVMKNIQGSGFVISSSGFALTNYHVIKSCQQIQTSQGFATAILQDPNNDIAVLKIKKPPHAKHDDFEALAFRKNNLNLGEKVYAVGYPLQDVLQNGLNLTSGDVSSLAGPNNDVRFVGISAPIQPGNSGGALLDEYGRVVAMTTSKLSDMKILKSSGSLPQNVGFALRQDLLKMVLHSHNIPYQEASALFSKDPEDMTNQAKEAILQISCAE